MHKIVKILKKIKIRNIIILIILLTFNTYAWFIYATKVSMGLTAHVSSWNVEFITGTGEEITTNIDIEVDRIYPGMEDFEKVIEVHNKGETAVKLSYEINSLKIMDEYFEVTEDSGITSEELEEQMKTTYPFQILIEKNEGNLEEESGKGSFKIRVVWPYESGNDELDTFWGNKAYEFYSLKSDEKCIELKMKLIATQGQKN